MRLLLTILLFSFAEAVTYEDLTESTKVVKLKNSDIKIYPMKADYSMEVLGFSDYENFEYRWNEISYGQLGYEFFVCKDLNLILKDFEMHFKNSFKIINIKKYEGEKKLGGEDYSGPCYYSIRATSLIQYRPYDYCPDGFIYDGCYSSIGSQKSFDCLSFWKCLEEKNDINECNDLFFLNQNPQGIMTMDCQKGCRCIDGFAGFGVVGKSLYGNEQERYCVKDFLDCPDKPKNYRKILRKLRRKHKDSFSTQFPTP